MIIFILEGMLLGIVAALIGIFYNYTLHTGSIFCKLGVILNDWAENESGFKGWIANPLGACIYCSTTWITILIMAIRWMALSDCPDDTVTVMIIGTLAAVGVQHPIIRIFVKLNNRE